MSSRSSDGARPPGWATTSGSRSGQCQRVGQDLGGVADRARRLSPRLRRRPCRDLQQAHARDRQPRRRDERRARGARARDARRRTRHVRGDAASRADADRGLALGVRAHSQRCSSTSDRARSLTAAGSGARRGSPNRPLSAAISAARRRACRSEASGTSPASRPARRRSRADPGPREPGARARSAPGRGRSRSTPHTKLRRRSSAEPARPACPTIPARSTRPVLLAERLRQRRGDAERGQRLDDRLGQQLIAAAGLLHPRVGLPPAQAQAPRVQRRRASAGEPLDGRDAGGAGQLEDLRRPRVAQIEPADRDRRAPWPPQPQRPGAVARGAVQQRMGDRDVESGVVLGVLVERGQAPTTAANSDSIVSLSSV